MEPRLSESKLNRDWVVWSGAVLLFLSGFLWAQFLPSSEFWKSEFDMKAVDYFSVASAIATAIAAFAAWRSASISRDAATDSRSFSRMQAYILHKQQFEVLLSDIEKELGITFREKNGLYNDIFPDNRHTDRPFSMKANGPEFYAWIDSFKDLVEQTNVHPPMGFRELKAWMVEQVVLADNFLRFRYSVDNETFRVGEIDTQVSIEDPMYGLELCNTVLNHFHVFGMIDGYLGMSSPPSWFETSLKEFKFRIYTHDEDCEYK
jgi:hypothetical protein